MQGFTSPVTLHHLAPREAITAWILPAEVAWAIRSPAQDSCAKSVAKHSGSGLVHLCKHANPVACQASPSQRSLHNAPIFRLLLKVAVNGTHQCDYSNFCGGLGSQLMPRAAASSPGLAIESSLSTSSRSTRLPPSECANAKRTSMRLASEPARVKLTAPRLAEATPSAP